MKRAWLVPLSVVVLLTGCSQLGAPPAGGPTPAPTPSNEQPSPPPPVPRVRAPSDSPQQAVRQFARTYINWNADNVTARLRALAATSVGQARSAVELAAAQAGGDYELHRGGIANHGVVEAVAPLSAVPSRYVVVTRETTTAALSTAYQGLHAAWHVAVATVAPAPTGGWVVSGWQPQS